MELSVGFLIYAIYIAMMQSGFVTILINRYVKVRKGKSVFYFLTFFALSLHDLFWSLLGTSERYVLLSIGEIVFLIAIFLLCKYCCKNNYYRSFIVIFAMEGAFQYMLTMLTFPVFILISNFNMEEVGLFLDKPGLINGIIVFVLYFLGLFFVTKIWKFVARYQGKKYDILCLVLCIFDIIAPWGAGWQILSICIPTLFLLIGYILYQQNRNDREFIAQQAYYNALSEMMKQKEQEISEIRHDIANHLSVMEEMSKDKQGQDILQKIDRGYGVVTGVPVLDCLISEKEKQCFEKEITFQVKSGLLGEISISEFDLISLFANLLDNAIEAAEKTDEKSVDLSIEKQQGCIKIVLNNSKAKEEEPMESKFATTKRDKQNHGIGTRIIKKIVNDNDGRITYEDQGSKMKVTVIIGG